MSTQTIADGLRLYCNAIYADSDGREKLFANPWVIRYQGATWTAATDGRTLVLAKGQHSPHNATEQIQRTLNYVLSLEAEHVTDADAEAIRQWTGEPPGRVLCDACGNTGDRECPDCNGDGYYVCDHCDSEVDCLRCGGEGYRDCPDCNGASRSPYAEPRPGIIADVRIDMDRLADALRLFDGTCQLCRSEDGGMLVMRSNTLLAYVMGLAGETEDVPVFNSEATQ